SVVSADGGRSLVGGGPRALQPGHLPPSVARGRALAAADEEPAPRPTAGARRARRPRLSARRRRHRHSAHVANASLLLRARTKRQSRVRAGPHRRALALAVVSRRSRSAFHLVAPLLQRGAPARRAAHLRRSADGAALSRRRVRRDDVLRALSLA